MRVKCWAAMMILLGMLHVAEAATVSIDDIGVPFGREYRTYIEIKDVNNLGAADIDLIFDPSIVHVTRVEGGNFDITMPNVNNATGHARIAAFQAGSPGLSGNVKLAYLTLKASGSSGSSYLNLNVITLKTVSIEQIQFSLKNGTFSITGMNTAGTGDREEPKVTPRGVTNASTKSKISQELLDEMEKAPGAKLQVIIQSFVPITSEADQVTQTGAQILNIRERMIVAKATPEQIKKIADYEWVSLIGLDVRGEALESAVKTPKEAPTPEETPRAPFVSGAALILALLLLTIKRNIN